MLIVFLCTLLQHIFPVVLLFLMGSCCLKALDMDSLTDPSNEAENITDSANDRQGNVSKDIEDIIPIVEQTDQPKDTFEGIYGDVFNRDLTTNIVKFAYVGDIEKELITAAEQQATMSTIYNINDSYFLPSEHNMSDDDDDLMNYEVYKEEKGPGLWSDDEDMTDVPLEITIQLVPNGLIINSNVYITDANWHTISSIEELYCCQVCQVYCNKLEIEEHVKVKAHLVKLDGCPPLRQYDLSIVRKIRDLLHCGVCNESFQETQFREHENTKTHEENLLTAINRVSDLMYDSDLKTNNFDNCTTERNILTDRFLNEENNRVERRNQNDQIRQLPANFCQFERNRTENQIVEQNRQFNTSERLHQISDRSHQISERSHQISERTHQIHERSGQSVLNRNVNSVEFPELRKNNNNLYLNANISVYDDFSDNEEYITPKEGVSYALMASTPRVELPKYLKIDLGTKEVRVKFESWHMLITPEKNKFYCMVCETSELMRNKHRHVTSNDHKSRLAACTVSAAYDSYLIRMLNDKLYHCGHCNNLQYYHQMEHHIDSVHPKTTRIINTTTTHNNVVIDKCKTEKKKIDVPVIDKTIFGDITISPFDSEVKISSLSYNVIINKDGQNYCAVCDKICTDVKAHVEELRHIEIINMTPFIRLFKSHLTRAIRGTLHCALCNELIQVSEIYLHNIEPKHTNALAAALGMKKAQKPIHIKNNSTKNKKLTTGNTKVDNPTEDFSLALKTALKTKINEQSAETTKLPLTPKNRAKITENDNNLEKTESQNKLRNNQFRTQNFAQVQNQGLLQAGQILNSGQSAQFGLTQQNPNIPSLLSLPLIKPASPLLPLPTQNLLQNGESSVQNQNSLLGIPPVLPLRTPHCVLQSEQNALLPTPQNLQSGQNVPMTTLNIPNTRHLLQPGQNALLPTPQNLQSGQNVPMTTLNIPNTRHLLQPGQNALLPTPQNLQSGQNVPITTSNIPHTRHLLQPMQNLSILSSNLPQTGQNLRFGHPLHITKKGPPVQSSQIPQNRPLLPIPNQNPLIPGQNFNYPNLNNFKLNSNQNQNIKTQTQNSNIKTVTQNSNIKTQTSNIKTQTAPNPKQENKENINIKNTVLNISDKEKPNITKSEEIKIEKPPAIKKNVAREFSLNLSLSDEDVEIKFDEEEYVLVTMKNAFFKVSNVSYNTLVYVDYGIRHCFVCSTMVKFEKFQHHIDSREHLKNIKKTKFLDKYSGQLFRQMYLMYHCTVCNVLMTGKEIKLHLDWPLHNECHQNYYNVINKKNRKLLKSGLKVHAVETQKEFIFHNVNEPEIKLLYTYQISDLKTNESKTAPKIKSPTKETKKRNKIIIVKNSVIKMPYDNWHSFTTSNGCGKCLVCQVELRCEQMLAHAATDYHYSVLGKPFLTQYYPALLRQISDKKVNCVVCNSEVANNKDMISIHVRGRKHTKMYENLLKESANSDSYVDCHEDVLNL